MKLLRWGTPYPHSTSPRSTRCLPASELTLQTPNTEGIHDNLDVTAILLDNMM